MFIDQTPLLQNFQLVGELVVLLLYISRCLGNKHNSRLKYYCTLTLRNLLPRTKLLHKLVEILSICSASLALHIHLHGRCANITRRGTSALLLLILREIFSFNNAYYTVQY